MNEIRCAIEFRADDSRRSPGRITGTLIVYGERANDRPEMFESGALEWPKDGILIREQHNREAPIVKALPFVDGDAVRIDVKAPDTTRGRDAVVNIREGVYTGLSVEFKSLAEGRRNGLRVISRAMLGGAGLVDYSSYTGSTVEVRSKGPDVRKPEIETLWL